MLTLALALTVMQQMPAETTPDAPVDWDEAFGVEEEVRDPETGEFPIDPYKQDNANAGADPFGAANMAEHFGGQAGIRAIAERTVDLSHADPRIGEIFAAHDMVRLKRTLFEQFCYILGAGCDYTGRDMASSHADMGASHSDLNALVENLQRAMREQGVPFAAQNRFLAKLAPMSRDVVTR